MLQLVLETDEESKTANRDEQCAQIKKAGKGKTH